MGCIYQKKSHKCLFSQTLQYLCLYMALFEAGNISGCFLEMSQINLVQLIVVMDPQLESYIIMTGVSRRKSEEDNIKHFNLIYYTKFVNVCTGLKKICLHYPSMRGYLDSKSCALSFSEDPDMKQQRENASRALRECTQRVHEAPNIVILEGISENRKPTKTWWISITKTFSVARSKNR